MIRKYWTAYAISLQETLQRRSSLLMDRVGGVAIIVSLYYFWKALLGTKPSFLGYSGEQMLSYVLVMNILRSFVFTGRGWQLVGEISSGRISSYLVRPISYHGYTLALDLAQKTVHLAAAFLEVGVLIAAIGARVYLPHSLSTWLLFSVSVAVSSLLFFFMEFMVSSLAFWTSESGGPLFCFELGLQFAAGTFFPLDVLPHSLQKALAMTPFPYMVFFPINIYLERMAPAEAVKILGIQAVWLAFFVWAATAVWKLGLSNYSAEGG
ncbi:MAG: ABC-2 family transporter protein [Elusimicrobia bacterium]|nr:ABC-2 family transporter protein [Elusimicrobiota bacterium]